METNILYRFAEDSDGKIISIDNALQNIEYYCPECKEKLVARKGNIRQHHFAHNNSSGCTGTGEGYLHKAFKKMLFETIKNRLNNKSPFVINWRCNICNTDHTGNLLNNITDVKDEHNLIECRPDIALIDNNGNTPIIIEVVVKHEPENNVIEFCKKNNMVLIKIKVETIDDLERVEKKLAFPSNVEYFYKLRCPIFYRNYILQQQLKAQMIPNTSFGVSRVNHGGPRIDQIQVAQDKKTRQLKAIRYNYAKKGRRK